MRYLYVDVNTIHINSTANELLLMLYDFCDDITFYGPGYLNDDCINEGILKFIKNNKTFDVVIFGPTCPIMSKSNEETSVEYVRVWTANKLDPKLVLSYFKDISKNFLKLEIAIKAISTLNYDHYTDPGKVLDMIEKNSLYLIGPNEQFQSLIENLPTFTKEEKHYKRKEGKFSDRWYNYTASYPERQITALHFVSINEFFFEPLEMRPYEVSVPGVEYVLRKKVLAELSNTNYKKVPKKLFYLYKLLNRLGIPVYNNRFGMSLYNTTFKNTLRDTKCVYKARGGFGIPVRKFFEIPASGTLMMCHPCIGFKELGFIPNKNYIDLENEGLLEALNHWVKNPKAQTIASNGQKLIATKHASKSRFDQINQCLKEIQKNNFLGSKWINGEYKIQTVI